MGTKAKKSWTGRFFKQSSPLLEEFNESLSFDKRLYAEDICGSVAHARMLHHVGLLTKKELVLIERGLAEIKKEIEKGEFVWRANQEDIHMAIEQNLIKKIGNAGRKLHTARSRNDQVATDLKLYAKKNLAYLTQAIKNLQKSLIQLAEQKGLVLMPGYTHLQRAQPIYLAHHLLAYVEMLERDKSRIGETYGRTDVSPLGSGALAGSPLPLDRNFVAKELGFKDITHNSLDAVSDRDFVCEILFNTSLVMMHLSRLAEELVLWSSQEFGFISLPQEFCTGSSMMPQKINPDVPELIRGKTGRVYGNLVSLLTTLKGLPLSYNKDLQEDKEPLFDSLDTTFIVLEILSQMIPKIEVNSTKMSEALKEGFLEATDLADYLVTKKVPFRKAHEIVGNIIQDSVKKKVTLNNICVDELQKYSNYFKSDVHEWLDINKAINKRNCVGGPALSQVKKELIRVKKLIL